VREEDRRLLQVLDGKDRCLILIQAAMFEASVAYFYGQTGEGELRLMHQFAVAGVLPEMAVENVTQPDQPSLPVGRTAGVISAPVVESGVATGAGWWNRRQRIVLSALMGSLTVFALGRLSVSPKRADPVPVARSVDPALVGLAVRNHGPKVELTWNTGSTAVRSAVHGSLLITSGRASNRVELSAAQIQAGAYEYTPAQSDLTFVLMLYQRDDSFAGQTQSFHANLPVTPPPAAIPQPKVAGPRRAVRPARKKKTPASRIENPPDLRAPRSR
jgi:hypothetical protein